MAEVLEKPYDCLNCHKPIRIAKIDNVPPGQKKQWQKYELDGLTIHKCNKNDKPSQQDQQQAQQVSSDRINETKNPSTNNNTNNDGAADIVREIAQIKAELRVNFEHIIMRLDAIQAEIKKQ